MKNSCLAFTFLVCMSCSNKPYNFPNKIESELSPNHTLVDDHGLYLKISNDFQYDSLIDRYKQKTDCQFKVDYSSDSYEWMKEAIAKDADFQKDILFQGYNGVYFEDDYSINLLFGDDCFNVHFIGFSAKGDTTARSLLQKIAKNIYFEKNYPLNKEAFVLNPETFDHRFIRLDKNHLYFSHYDADELEREEGSYVIVKNWEFKNYSNAKIWAKLYHTFMEENMKEVIISMDSTELMVNGHKAFVIESTAKKRLDPYYHFHGTIYKDPLHSVVFIGREFRDKEHVKTLFWKGFKSIEFKE